MKPAITPDVSAYLQPPHASPTIGAALDAATRALAESGSRSPRLDAEVLLAEATGRSRTWLLTWTDRRLEDEARARFDALLTRRAAREPVAYILGRRGFYDLELAVSPDVLIPRAETEVLVEEALAWLRQRSGARVLDVGTGSGAIAIAVAKHGDCTVTATDISPAALAVARSNADRNGVVGIDWREGDLFEAVDGQRFDLILSNPPYVSEKEYHGLEPNVRDYEPYGALVAGADGLAVLEKLCRQAPTYLRSGGALGVEIGTAQGPAVHRLMSGNGFEAVRVTADLAGHDRVVWGQRWTQDSSTN